MTEPGQEGDSIRQRTRIAAYALCVRNSRILLCRIAPGDADAGQWTLPGGGLTFAESPSEGALRELAEETGLSGSIVGLAEVLDWSGRVINPADGVDEALHSIQIVYRVEISGGEPRDEVGGSTDAARWLTREEAEALPLVDLARAAVLLGFGA